jgi:hypothetical protein
MKPTDPAPAAQPLSEEEIRSFEGHTPGEWRAGVDAPAAQRPTGVDTDDVYADGGCVCRMTGDVLHAYADARLIAAAPRLLALAREAGELRKALADTCDDLETIAVADQIPGHVNFRSKAWIVGFAEGSAERTRALLARIAERKP